MRSSLALALVLWPWVAVAALAAPPRREIIERVVAVVDERPLLLSDVRALGVVRGLTGDEAREAAIDERLMYHEAARLPQAEVSPEEEDEEFARLLAARPGLEDAVPEPDLRRLVRRQAAILRYVEFRFRPQLRVSDDAVRRAWEEERSGRPEGPAFEDEQSELRARLERRALDERIEAWVRELRARADVRYVEAPSPPAAPGP